VPLWRSRSPDALVADVRLGAGDDFTHLLPLSGAKDPSASLTSARWSQSLVFTAAAGASVALARRVRAGVHVSIDVLPTTVHYDVANGGSTEAIVSPRRVRPGLAVELAFVLGR